MNSRVLESIRNLNDVIRTPFYLFDEASIEKNYMRLCTLLYDLPCDYSIAYSIKTNPHDFVVAKADAYGAWAEATSLRELRQAKRQGFTEIIFNGIFKTEEEMLYAVEIGAIIVLDGRQQLENICKIATDSDKQLKVGVRISSFPIQQDDGIRFGISPDTREFCEHVQALISHKNIDLCCLHTHLGSKIVDPSLYGLSLERLCLAGKTIESLGASIRIFDLGGGMPGFFDSFWQSGFSEALLTSAGFLLDSSKTVVIEPGRGFVETAGFLVVRVVDIRMPINNGRLELIVDAGTNCLIGENLGVIHTCLPVMPHNGHDQEYRLIGPLCCADDIILEKMKAGAIHIGDLLIITSVGAYDFSTAYAFSDKLPDVFCLDKGGRLNLLGQTKGISCNNDS